jgi:hypothetical protein
VYLRTLPDSPILLVAHRTELEASVALATACLGGAGTIMNNRPFLAVCTLMLWVCFGLMVVPGYLTYKRRSLNLDGKVRAP